MLPGVAEDLAEQFAGAVDHPRLAAEALGTGHVADDAHDPGHRVQPDEVVDGGLRRTGKVGGSVDVEAAAADAKVCALNALAAIDDLVGLDSVARIVRVVGYVASAEGFSGQPRVVNGASEFLGKIFGEAGRHARSAVGVAELPLGAPVEVELTVELR